MNILFLAAEADPLVKVGGLGDVAGTLPIAINAAASSVKAGLEVRVVIPYHQVIKDKGLNTTLLGRYSINSIKGQDEVIVYEYQVRGTIFYLLDGDPIQKTSEPYSQDTLLNGGKYVFFSFAALRLPAFLDWPINILHANDWHTALAVFALKVIEQNKAIKTILSVHNLAYMGNGIEEVIKSFGIPAYDHPDLPDWARLLPLPMGLAAADAIVTVSPGYAEEILTPEYGCGLESMLQQKKQVLSGVLNGIDIDIWNPTNDLLITHHFNPSDMTGKEHNKTALQSKLALPVNPKDPLITTISRLDYQKGMDLLVDALYQLPLQDNWQFIILGTGDPYLEMRARNLQADRPDHVRTIIDFDQKLAHQIYAGADIFIMPSRYEPCGISQMISQRYGTIPLAHATGGLIDTIINSTSKLAGTGYLFEKLNATTLASKISQAISAYHKKTFWLKMQQNAMAQDFSWNLSAQKYIHLYKDLVSQ